MRAIKEIAIATITIWREEWPYFSAVFFVFAVLAMYLDWRREHGR